ncbi:PPR repeat [Musa troglodytarum]|uniref:PPR repeat n=1 Tax=Musa troglodytarum TaxID=320322 RepID=A0A9E7EGZ1_9LILI|nr:PPR repeat [Musa troglodytarum]
MCLLAEEGVGHSAPSFSMRPRMVGKQRSDRQTVAPKAPLAGVLCSFCLLLTNVQLKSQKQATYISGYHATRMMIVSGHADAIVNVRHANLMDVVALQHNAY